MRVCVCGFVPVCVCVHILRISTYFYLFYIIQIDLDIVCVTRTHPQAPCRTVTTPYDSIMINCKKFSSRLYLFIYLTFAFIVFDKYFSTNNFLLEGSVLEREVSGEVFPDSVSTNRIARFLWKFFLGSKTLALP